MSPFKVRGLIHFQVPFLKELNFPFVKTEEQFEEYLCSMNSDNQR